MYIWLALRFPFFKLQAHGVNIVDIGSTEDQVATACVVASSNKQVCAATPQCFQEGVQLGMPVSTAQALLPCEVKPRSDDLEAQLLQKVSDALYAFTPYIQSYYPNEKDESCDQGLLLELSRCLRLFGSLEALYEGICSALVELGIRFKSALSQSAKAAWLLSSQDSFQYSSKSSHQYSSKDRADLDIGSIHIRELDEFPEQAEALEGMGFLTLSDTAKHIEKEGLAALQKRFDTAFIQYLFDILSIELKQDALNSPLSQPSLFDDSKAERTIKPRAIYEPKEVYSDGLSFDYPLNAIELLHEPMQHLLKRLSEYLISKQKQCAGIQWRFSDIYQNQDLIDVRCELIYRDWQLLHELSLIKLEQSGLAFEVDQLELVNPIFLDAELSTDELHIDTSGKQNINRRDVQRVVTKIQARLGEESVFKVTYKDEHFPECAQRRIGVQEAAAKPFENGHQPIARPGWILNTPITIGKHQNNLNWNGKVELVRGPERLEGHWWNKPTARDYYIAVRSDQVRLWIFNDLFREEWFVQGVF